MADPLPAIPPNIAMITGPTMIGIVLNWGLMGILTVQTYFYHLHFSKDSAVIKSLVYGLVCLDVLQTAMITADAFHWFVFGFGNMNQLDETFLNSWDVCLLDAVIALIVQTFYCWRIFILRRRSFWFPTLIMAVSLAGCAGGLVTAIKAFKHGKLSLISTQVVEQTLWLSASALSDVLITVVLGWTLLKRRSPELENSSRMLSRIIRITVETNSLTAGVAVIALIIFFAADENPTLVVPPTAIIGKLYTNCLLAVFNHRRLSGSSPAQFSGNHESGPTHHSFRPTESGVPRPLRVQVVQEVDRDAGDMKREQDLEMSPLGDAKYKSSRAHPL